MVEKTNDLLVVCYRVVILGIIYCISNIGIFYPLYNTRSLNFMNGLNLFGYMLLLLLFPSTVAMVAVTRDYIHSKLGNVLYKYLTVYKRKFWISFKIGIIYIFTMQCMSVYWDMFVSMKVTMFLQALPATFIIILFITAIHIPRLILFEETNIIYIYKTAFLQVYTNMLKTIGALLVIILILFLFNFIPLSICVTPVSVAYILSE